MTIDIIIYAVIAVAILAKLWSVLGRRNDEDASRPNPFTPPPQLDPARLNPKTAPNDVPVLPPIISLPPTSLDGGLAQVRALDPAFDERDFLRQARADFSIILSDFAQGELARSTGKLGPNVKRNFAAAIGARKAAGQTLSNTVIRMVDVETVAARTDGTTASVTVQFVSDQENVLRDSDGRVIGGEAGQREQITDRWRFSRDTAVAGSAWQVVETV